MCCWFSLFFLSFSRVTVVIVNAVVPVHLLFGCVVFIYFHSIRDLLLAVCCSFIPHFGGLYVLRLLANTGPAAAAADVGDAADVVAAAAVAAVVDAIVCWRSQNQFTSLKLSKEQ